MGLEIKIADFNKNLDGNITTSIDFNDGSGEKVKINFNLRFKLKYDGNDALFDFIGIYIIQDKPEININIRTNLVFRYQNQVPGNSQEKTIVIREYSWKKPVPLTK